MDDNTTSDPIKSVETLRDAANPDPYPDPNPYPN